jgi:hypothetical protein
VEVDSHKIHFNPITGELGGRDLQSPDGDGRDAPPSALLSGELDAWLSFAAAQQGLDACAAVRARPSLAEVRPSASRPTFMGAASSSVPPPVHRGAAPDGRVHPGAGHGGRHHARDLCVAEDDLLFLRVSDGRSMQDAGLLLTGVGTPAVVFFSAPLTPHRAAGSLHKLEAKLRRVAPGEAPRPVKFRDKTSLVPWRRPASPHSRSLLQVPPRPSPRRPSADMARSGPIRRVEPGDATNRA